MKAIRYCITLVMLLLAVACAKNKSENSKKVANTPVATADCLFAAGSYGNSTCVYDYARHNGFRNYVYDVYAMNTGYTNGFCGCQSGYMPVYNSNWGLGCVASQYTSSSSYIYYSWNATNTQWVNIPQTAPSVPSTGSCYSDAMYACDPSLANSCGNQGQCLAIAGSRLGVCQYRSGYSYYSSGGGYSGGWYGGGGYYYGGSASGGYYYNINR